MFVWKPKRAKIDLYYSLESKFGEVLVFKKLIAKRKVFNCTKYLASFSSKKLISRYTSDQR